MRAKVLCDSRPLASIAQSMQAIVLSHHHEQDRVTFHHAMQEDQQGDYAPK